MQTPVKTAKAVVIWTVTVHIIHLLFFTVAEEQDVDHDAFGFFHRIFGDMYIFTCFFLQVTENIISKQTFIGEHRTHTNTHRLQSNSPTAYFLTLLRFLSPSEARTMPRSFNNSGSKFMTSVVQRPSAHLTLRDSGSQGERCLCASSWSEINCGSRILGRVKLKGKSLLVCH